MEKTCLKCGYTRSASDVAPHYECPKCGAIYAKVEAIRRNESATSKTEVEHNAMEQSSDNAGDRYQGLTTPQKLLIGIKRGLMWSAAIILSVAILAECSVNYNASSSRARVDGNIAHVMCSQYVEDRLKTPATADFPPVGNVTDMGGGKYIVRSYVDAQNVFGAMLRTHYSCTIQHVDGDRWSLVNLSIK